LSVREINTESLTGARPEIDFEVRALLARSPPQHAIPCNLASNGFVWIDGVFLKRLFNMSNESKIVAEHLTPILYVRDFAEAMSYYTEKLLFKRLWEWGTPPDFGAVGIGNFEIFFCLKGQGCPGTWLAIMIDNVDEYFERITKLGAEVSEPPADMPWGLREMQVRDPNGHVIRFGHGIPMREPKMEIERVPVETRIEKRLAALMVDLARHKNMTVGEMLEEMLLHSFEKLSSGGVASPHTERTLSYIQELKAKHGIDYDVHASYRFVEKTRSAG
jgi:predicted enzyme related to lactoylglutathione lyase